MSDVKCPYCSADQEINHDDGQGFDEDTEHEQCCLKCDKYFKFTTSVSYYYGVYCQSDDHKMEPFGEKFPGMYECEKCDFYERRE